MRVALSTLLLVVAEWITFYPKEKIKVSNANKKIPNANNKVKRSTFFFIGITS